MDTSKISANTKAIIANLAEKMPIIEIFEREETTSGILDSFGLSPKREIWSTVNNLDLLTNFNVKVKPEKGITKTQVLRNFVKQAQEMKTGDINKMGLTRLRIKTSWRDLEYLRASKTGKENICPKCQTQLTETAKRAWSSDYVCENGHKWQYITGDAMGGSHDSFTEIV